MTLEGIEDAWQPTPMQSGMLFHCLQNEHTDVYITYIITDLHGDLNVGLFKRAWHETINAHAALRASFLHEGLDEPLAIIHSSVSPEWSIHDLSGMPSDQQHASYTALLELEKSIPLAPENAPLLRFRLIRLADTSWRLIWTCHHLLADGWSTPIVLADVVDSYHALVNGEIPQTSEPFSFPAYLAALDNRDYAAARTYWSEELKAIKRCEISLPPRSHFSTSHPEKGQLYEQCSVVVSREITEKLARGCRQNRLTLSTLIHAAWAILLSDYCGQDRVMFGTSTAGRSSDVPGMERAVGLFLTTLPLVVSVGETIDVRVWLSEIQQKMQQHMLFDHFPLGEMSGLSAISPNEALFDTLVVVESHTSDLSFCGGGIELSDIQYDTHSHFPLVLLAYPGKQLTLTLVHDLAEFHVSEVNQILRHYERLLTVMNDCLQADQGVSLLSLRNQCSALCDRGYNVRAIEPDSVDFRRVDWWFEAVCDSKPDHAALVFDKQCVSYRQLDERANQIAHLLNNTLGPSASLSEPLLIGVYLTRCVDQIAAMLACLKFGAAYVPLDPEYPIERTHQIVRLAQLAVVASTNELSHGISNAGVLIADINRADECEISRVADQIGTSDDLAYVMFTSGSTGTPKGVCITHDNLMFSTSARVAQYSSQRNCFLLLSSIAFDSSVAGIYGTLCSGGTLVIPGSGVEKELHLVCQLILENRVSRMLLLPSLYQLLLQYGDLQMLQSLELVIVAGERCSPELVAMHHSSNAQVMLYNEYGPTEACVWSTFHECTSDDLLTVPIGRPIADCQCLVISDQNRLCPQGVVGELCLAGRGVFPGYLDDAEIAIQPFIEENTLWSGSPRLYRTGDLAYWGQDQRLIYVGRKDRQIKMRGFRIEPAEIEAALRQSPTVDEVVVISSNDRQSFTTTQKTGHSSNRQLLLVYYTISSQTDDRTGIETISTAIEILDERDHSELIAKAGELLPGHMQPNVWIALNRMPRLPNGKIDLGNLPAPESIDQSGQIRSDDANNRGCSELCQILASLLGIEKVDAQDNFFELGADSITAIQFSSKAREAGWNISVASITSSISIGMLAENASNASVALEAFPDTGRTALTPIQNWFFDQQHSQAQWWNMAGVATFPGLMNFDVLEKAIRASLSRHRVLGASFHQDGSTWYSIIPEEDPPENLMVRANPESFEYSSDDADSWKSIVDSAQAEFRLEHGWMLRFILVSPGAQSHGGLVWVAHHLIIDVVSIETLLSEIQSDYSKLLAGDQSEQPGSVVATRTSVSYRQWAELLAGHALERAANLKESLTTAKFDDATRSMNFLSGNLSGSACESEKKTCQVELTGLSAESINNINKKFGIRAQDMLLFVVSQTLCEVLKLDRISVDIEHHGRDLLGGEVVADHSIGWFSNMFPFSFDASLSIEQPESVKSFKELFRAAAKENAFDLLDNSHPPRKIGNSGIRAFLFNYHGSRRSDEQAEALWLHEHKMWPSLRAPQNRCSHALELNLWQMADRLHCNFQYVASCFDDSFIDALIAGIGINLKKCSHLENAHASREYTPSDFPDLDMNQSELDTFLDSLE